MRVSRSGNLRSAFTGERASELAQPKKAAGNLCSGLKSHTIHSAKNASVYISQKGKSATHVNR
jgi:hypothetical protein